MADFNPEKGPQRAHSLIVHFGADTEKDLAGLLRHMAWQIDAGQLSVGCSGGYSSGAMYSYRIRPEQTHDAYFQQVDEWLARRAETPAHD